jgi:ubiquitin-conjugating enzyme E2 J1
VKEKICLTFTNYHPEYWQPAWTIRNILQALVSFMPVDEDNMSIGAIVGTREERTKLAKHSLDFVCEQCGAIAKVAKDNILPVTTEATPAASGMSAEFASLLKLAPAKKAHSPANNEE